MKKILRLILIILLLVAGVTGWLLFASNTNFNGARKSLYIKTGSNFEEVINNIEAQNFLKNPIVFIWLAKNIGYDKNVKPGKYVISKGSSIFKILRTLKSGRQTPVNFIITKLRTKENLAAKIAANFETDSSTFIDFLNNNDSLLQYGLDSNTVMTAIFPNTYNFLWTTPPSKIFKKLFAEHERFWTTEKRKEAATLKLTISQAYTLASIVEEETNASADKRKIASVYLNRLHTGMKLSADPTIKFALRDFGLKRIYLGHINAAAASPYNTYKFAGLPPGPICTVSEKTIDTVLNAPTTNYLYFVAKPDNSGLSNFTDSYQQHQINAKKYQHYLDSINIR